MYDTKIFSGRQAVIFLFCAAILFGPTINVLFTGDWSQYPDTKTYLGLFNLDFNQSPVRRYRVITPLLAKLLHAPFGGLFAKMAPGYYAGNFSVAMSFYMVNMAITCISGTLLYRYCRLYGATVFASLVGLLFFLTNRYTICFASIPLVDALYFLTVVLALVGIKQRNTTMLIAAIFIGPFAKEAFVFVAPVIFFFAPIPKWRQAIYFLLSGLLVFTFRYVYDARLGYAPDSGLAADMAHVRYMKYSAAILFSGYGLYKIFINLGSWIMLPLAGALWQKGFLGKAGKNTEPYVWAYLICVFAQMLISPSTERMFYMALPVLCPLMARTADVILRRWNKNEILG